MHAPALALFSLHLKNKLGQELLLELGPFAKSTFKETHTGMSRWSRLHLHLHLQLVHISGVVYVHVPVRLTSSPDSSWAF